MKEGKGGRKKGEGKDNEERKTVREESEGRGDGGK